MYRPVLVATFLLLTATSSWGVCTEESLAATPLWNYNGTIGDRYRVRVTLTVASDSVEGVYFYATQFKDIRISGRISAGETIALEEYDSNGHVTARFKGKFQSQACEGISGSWYKIGDPMGLPFKLSMESATGGTLSHRYVAAGATDDDLVHANAFRFWDAVIKNDKSKVAALINYPVRVYIAGKPRSIRTRQELISRYDAVFTSPFRNKIAAALPRNMFVRFNGIMLGNGEVWFGPDGRVITLNNE